SGTTAPTPCWALSVITLEAADISNSGSFSTKNDSSFWFRVRLSGQMSSSNRTNGSVTSIGLLNTLKPKRTITNPWRERDGVRAYFTWAQIAHRPKNVLNKSLRSAIQATDSTWTG